MSLLPEIRSHLRRVRPLLVDGKFLGEYEWLRGRLHSIDTAYASELEARLAALQAELSQHAGTARENSEIISDKRQNLLRAQARRLKIYSTSMTIRSRVLDLCHAGETLVAGNRVKALNTIRSVKHVIEGVDGDIVTHEKVNDYPTNYARTYKKPKQWKYFFGIDAYSINAVTLLNILRSAQDGAYVTFLGDPRGHITRDCPFTVVGLEEGLDMPVIEALPSVLPVLAPAGDSILSGTWHGDIKADVGGKISDYIHDYTVVVDDAATVFAQGRVHKMTDVINEMCANRLHRGLALAHGDPCYLPRTDTEQRIYRGDRGNYVGMSRGQHKVWLPDRGQTVTVPEVKPAWCLPHSLARQAALTRVCYASGRDVVPKRSIIYELSRTAEKMAVITSSQLCLDRCLAS